MTNAHQPRSGTQYARMRWGSNSDKCKFFWLVSSPPRMASVELIKRTPTVALVFRLFELRSNCWDNFVHRFRTAHVWRIKTVSTCSQRKRVDALRNCSIIWHPRCSRERPIDAAVNWLHWLWNTLKDDKQLLGAARKITTKNCYMRKTKENDEGYQW